MIRKWGSRCGVRKGQVDKNEEIFIEGVYKARPQKIIMGKKRKWDLNEASCRRKWASSDNIRINEVGTERKQDARK